MRVFVVTPPASLPVTWDEVRAHLRMEADDERQSYVMALAAAATDHIDGPNGWLGRAICVQTLEARFDSFDCGSIRLPYPPTISVTSIKYIGAGGGEVTIDPAAYEILGASLVPIYGTVWPMPRWQREAVRIQYQAGYAPTDADPPVSTVPAPIRIAIGMMVRGMFEGRPVEEALEGAPAALLNPLRVYA